MMLMRELVVHWHVDPAILHIGAFELRWYSLLFVSGFILGWFIFKWFFQREKIDTKLLDPLLYTLLICTIVGARLGHCLFYQPDYYLGSWAGFWEIFMPWKGGLASHGGTIALILGMWWFGVHYGKKHDFDFVWLLDHLAIAVAFAGAFIRFGNLFNSEIYGDVTNLPWGFVFELRGETEPKHPTQLYEGFTYLLLGFALIGLYWKKLDQMFRGQFIGIFLIVCFGSRFLIEFIKDRADDGLEHGPALVHPVHPAGHFLPRMGVQEADSRPGRAPGAAEAQERGHALREAPCLIDYQLVSICI